MGGLIRDSVEANHRCGLGKKAARAIDYGERRPDLSVHENRIGRVSPNLAPCFSSFLWARGVCPTVTSAQSTPYVPYLWTSMAH